ncbi:MAG: CHASE domain-containing protein [Sulfurifustaceae bacterium]
MPMTRVVNAAKVRLPKFGVRSAAAIFTALVLTGAAWYAVRTSVDLYESARFEVFVDQIHDDISFRMRTYVNALIQTKGMFVVAGKVSREDFARYVRTVTLMKRYPGIQGIGYAARVPAADLARFVARERAPGLPQYKVWPEGRRDEYFPVLYLEPSDWRNQRAFGYDMASEPTRAAAMHAARDSGEPSLSGKATLVQETEVGRQPGFLIYVPVYRNGAPTGNVEERRGALVGFVYSPFRARDLFEAIFASSDLLAPVDFEVYDGSTPTPENLLYDRDGVLDLGNNAAHARFRKQFNVEIAGRSWTVIVHTLPAFDLAWATYLPRAVLLVGLLVTLLLAATLRAYRKEIDTSRRTRFLLESMSDGVCVVDESGVIQYTNPAEDRMFGYAPGELIGQQVSVLNNYPPEENRRVVRAVIAALHAEGMWRGEFQNKKKDGAPFITAARITTIDVAGRKYFLSVLQDISERVRAERALRESEMRFRQIADQTPQMIWMSGADGRWTYFNRSWLDFTGRSSDQELGCGWLEGVHPDERDGCERAFTAVLRAHDEFSIEYRLRRHDGAYRWIVCKGVPRFTEPGEFVGFIASCVDITDHKEFEQRLQEAIKARDTFLSVISHELRTPLTSLKLQAQIRRKRLEAGQADAFTADKLAKMIETDNRQIDRLTQLVDDMLDISRINSDRFPMHLERADLCALAKEVTDRLGSRFEAARCPVRVECATPVQGNWDHFRLEQVLVNLLTNATKYGAGKPIDVTVRAAGGRAVLEVRDRGIGIAASDQQRIFERYERVTGGDKIAGLGLGLFIVRRIVEAHGGTVRVKSEPGAGSTFIVELPLTSSPDRSGM